ncbi:MAG: hypothetical protein E6Q98_20185 [Rhodospirillaceae bacterium]|nr:MAG: hypothetical protein E6Q98_20185 [Rhodospirillaceae bacterium]
MKTIRNIVLTAVLALAVTPPAQARSLQELNDELKGSEQYFQPADSATPDFVLQDGERVILLLGLGREATETSSILIRIVGLSSQSVLRS